MRRASHSLDVMVWAFLHLVTEHPFDGVFDTPPTPVEHVFVSVLASSTVDRSTTLCTNGSSLVLDVGGCS